MSGSRLERLVAATQAADLAGIVLMPDANLTYLSGLSFHPGKRLTLALIPADGTPPCLVLPALERSKCEAGSQVAWRYFAWGDAEGPMAALQAACAAAFPAGLDARALAIEYTALRVMELRALEAVMPGLLTTDATPLLASLRMVKDATELAAITEAVRIVEVALEYTLGQIQPGLTERQLSRICADATIAAGADSESFANIVAGGPNGANPHHSNSDRPLQRGDLIIIDCGARWGGYISDLTRTVALGEPGEEARLVYELVLLANEAGRAAATAGASGAQIDAAARAVITAGGYGDFFIHRTGHGFGIEGHELPNIVAGSNAPLAPGTTFTVEPGIYLPGKFGVRIEDDLVMEAHGARSLTSFPRELIVLPGV